jgi:tRNA(Arg) A34 adenosine deaminase TadA
MSGNFLRNTVLSIVLSVSLIGCAHETTLGKQNVSQSTNSAVAEGRIPPNSSDEADWMATRAAIAIVYKDWQTNWDPQQTQFMRGYNIGSVLIDWPNGKAWWARNNVGCFNNGTQHGEVRAMQQYTFASNQYYIDKATIYTTLEPCVMCAGMMSMEKVSRTIYAQHDPSFGDALQRLALDSTALPKGYPPYPRVTKPSPSALGFYVAINDAYAKFCSPKSFADCNIVQFLATPTAKALYENETRTFLNYKPIYSENASLQIALLKLYNEAPISNGQCKDPAPIPNPPGKEVGGWKEVSPVSIR